MHVNKRDEMLDIKARISILWEEIGRMSSSVKQHEEEISILREDIEKKLIKCIELENDLKDLEF